MLLVPAAASVSTLLVVWELMALTSLLLVLAEHRAAPGRCGEAGRWYAVMTHLGFLAILAGLVVFAAAARRRVVRAVAGRRRRHLPGGARRGVRAALLGFGSKAGLVPLHVWLPRAHPEAPSHVSALMCAAMVNLGVYGVLRVGFDLLGGGSRWWWLLVLAVGAVSALYGILQAAVAADLKAAARLLHHREHGPGLPRRGRRRVLRRDRAPALLAAAGAGRGAAARGQPRRRSRRCCSLGRVGAARHRHPRPGRARAGCARGCRSPRRCSASARWPPRRCRRATASSPSGCCCSALVHALPTSATATAVVMPVAVAVVALTAGLAVATFVKAFGVGFLARPRSAGAARGDREPAVDAGRDGPRRGRVRRAGAGPGRCWCPACRGRPGRRWVRRRRRGARPGDAAADRARRHHVAAADRGRPARPLARRRAGAASGCSPCAVVRRVAGCGTAAPAR